MIRVATVAGAAELEAEVADRLGRTSEIELFMRCMDRTEILAVIRSRSVDVIVLAGAPSWFDAQCIHEAVSAGIKIGGLARDPLDAEDFAAKGIAILEEPAFSEIEQLLAEAANVPPSRDIQSSPAEGRSIAVWGPKGSPGRTTVAIELACALAARGRATALVDGDPYGGDVKQLLGVTEEVATVIWAASMASKGQLDEGHLRSELRRAGERGPVVLPGLPRGDMWQEVSEHGWTRLLETCLSRFQDVIVDTGPNLESLDGSIPTLAAGRNRMTLNSLRAADRVVVVVRADPVGLKHLFWSLEALEELVPRDRCIFVLNRHAGAEPADVLGALKTRLGVTPAVLVPFRPGELTAAVEQGRSLHEIRPTSPVVEAITHLAEKIVADPRPRGFLARLGGRA